MKALVFKTFHIWRNDGEDMTDELDDLIEGAIYDVIEQYDCNVMNVSVIKDIDD